jgi:hypothetical protein
MLGFGPRNQYASKETTAMRIILAAAILAVLSASPAVSQSSANDSDAVSLISQSFGGEYTVKGRNFDGGPYDGTATITLTSDRTCKIIWQTGSTTSEGICMLSGRTFTAAYRSGKIVGLVIYEVLVDGSLTGAWTIADYPGIGYETLTRK